MMGISGRIARIFLHSQMTPLLALVAMLLGIFAVVVTPREEEPQINVTMANVMIPYPGASSQDVARTVSTPAEQVLSQIAGVDHVYSVSQHGMSVITVQFKVGEEHVSSLVKLYDVINSHSDWLPPTLGVMQPIIKAHGIYAGRAGVVADRGCGSCVFRVATRYVGHHRAIQGG